jgi:hypothetical protein
MDYIPNISKNSNKKLRTWIWNKCIGVDKSIGKCYLCPNEITLNDYKYIRYSDVRVSNLTDITENLVPVCFECSISYNNSDKIKLKLSQDDENNFTCKFSTMNILNPVVYHYNKFEEYYKYCLNRGCYQFPLDAMLNVLIVKLGDNIIIMNTSLTQITDALKKNSNQDEYIRGQFFLGAIKQYCLNNLSLDLNLLALKERLLAIYLCLTETNALPIMTGDSDLLKSIYVFHLVVRYYQQAEIKGIDIHHKIILNLNMTVPLEIKIANALDQFVYTIKMIVDNINTYEEYLLCHKIIMSF